MRFPHDKYITVLLLRGFSEEAILDRLTSVGYAGTTSADLAYRRSVVNELLPKDALIKLPEDKEEFDERMKLVMPVMSAQGFDDILPVFTGGAVRGWSDVMAVVTDSKLRLAIQSLSLLGETDSYIIEILANNFGFTMPQASLDLFKKYFWDLDSMNRAEVALFIESVPAKKHKNLLIDALYKRPAAIKWTQAKENILDSKTVLQEVMNEAFQKFLDLSKADNKEDTNVITKWAQTAIKAAEKLERLSGKKNLNVIESLKFEFQTKNPATIALITELKDEIV